MELGLNSFGDTASDGGRDLSDAETVRLLVEEAGFHISRPGGLAPPELFWPPDDLPGPAAPDLVPATMDRQRAGIASRR